MTAGAGGVGRWSVGLGTLDVGPVPTIRMPRKPGSQRAAVRGRVRRSTRPLLSWARP